MPVLLHYPVFEIFKKKQVSINLEMIQPGVPVIELFGPPGGQAKNYIRWKFDQ
jgi:hypothetical protein